MITGIAYLGVAEGTPWGTVTVKIYGPAHFPSDRRAQITTKVYAMMLAHQSGTSRDELSAAIAVLLAELGVGVCTIDFS